MVEVQDVGTAWGMSFFDTIPVPPQPPQRWFRQPEWLSAPEHMVGRFAALEPALARSADAAVVLDGFAAYPSGVAFHLLVRTRRDDDPEPFTHRGRVHPQPDEDGLRIGVEYADGGRTSNDVWRPYASAAEPPDGPLLTVGGGGGGGRSWDQRLWLWPLPPAGPLAFVVRWVRAGIAETRIARDAGPLRDAAAAAVELWPEDRPLYTREHDSG